MKAWIPGAIDPGGLCGEEQADEWSSSGIGLCDHEAFGALQQWQRLRKLVDWATGKPVG
jgi:hypothetical protein